MVSFPLVIRNPKPTAAELVLAATIAAQYPGVCRPDQVARCVRCRCRHEAREMLEERSVN